MDAFPYLRSGCARAALPALFACGLLFSGCRHQNCDLVEAELRHKEELLYTLKTELEGSNGEVEALEKQIDQLRQQRNKPVDDPAALGLIVKRVSLGRRTGGYDLKLNQPGDEALLVALEPRDFDDHSIKASGELLVEAYEINVQGMKTLIDRWHVPRRKLRETWETSLLGTPSYRVTLPWNNWPTVEEIRVVAKFTADDGQQFEADKDVKIKLAANTQPKSIKRIEEVRPPAAEADNIDPWRTRIQEELEAPVLELPSSMQGRSFNPPPPQPPELVHTALRTPSGPPPAGQADFSPARYKTVFYQPGPPPAEKKGYGLRCPVNARPDPKR